MSDVLRVLREARELIADKTRWTRRAFARSHAGLEIAATDTRATCWCGAGAVMLKAGEDLTGSLAWPAWASLCRASRELFWREPQFVNDDLGHEAILQVFDAAIAAEQAKLASPSP